MILFEQVALMLVCEMPVLAAARQIGITDKRLWRVVAHYVEQALVRLDLSTLEAVATVEPSVGARCCSGVANLR